MILFDPNNLDRYYPDARSSEVIEQVVAFFESKGKRALKDDYHDAAWYADFVDFQKKEGLFATMSTPAGYGGEDSRWDTWRVCEFAEALGFYGLAYWYVWQVSVLGLGPIFMSDNEAAKTRAAQLLADGEIFAFGLSEKKRGADVYSTDMVLTPTGDGTWSASGGKYYIGNGNKAAMVSTFGRFADTGEYVFFVADSQHEQFNLVKNVVRSQSYVSHFELEDYPVTEADILHTGDDAWNAALNTVNIGKYNLGWAAIGIATHALYEAINHAGSRKLYGKFVTEFTHVARLCVDAYCRLTAMKLVALRACDYMRSASLDDRRYLLYNPIVKTKVTTEGENVINDLWDVIAAKGFEEDTYFEQAAVEIRGLPKLEGTVHVNVALITKFMANYLFAPKEYAEVPTRSDAADDAFLFDQGPTRGLSRVQFHDYEIAYGSSELSNVKIFREQIAALKEMLMASPPDDEQQKDVDFLHALGEMFTLVPYGQLILENAANYDIGDDLVDEIFGVLVRDFSKFAVGLSMKDSSTSAQQDACVRMIRKPAVDEARFERVLDQVLALNGHYEMRP